MNRDNINLEVLWGIVYRFGVYRFLFEKGSKQFKESKKLKNGQRHLGIVNPLPSTLHLPSSSFPWIKKARNHCGVGLC